MEGFALPQRIIAVEPGSIACQHGIKSGDTLVSINHVPVLDLVDYQYLTARPSLELFILTSEQTERILFIQKKSDSPLGITLESSLMSCPKTCANHCVFCFIEQMPPGMRESLYVRDDDWRLSLMAGNFVTLTNLPPSELQRIIERHASPLYISVHTTNGELRKKMLNHRHADNIMDLLTLFASNNISFHCQIVLCPGINDGTELDKTLSDLAALHPHALTAALVPVGLTKYREHLYPLRPYTQTEAEQVIQQAERVQKHMLEKHGSRFVFPSDEFYQIAHHELPSDEAYEDYPQFENGVGLLRRLKTEFYFAWKASPEAPCKPRHVVMATGTSVAPFMSELVHSVPFPGVTIDVHPIINHFFGDTVTVSGLITGTDLADQLKNVYADEILITENMLRKGESVFLDDMTLDELQAILHCPVIPVPDDGADLLYALRGISE